MVVSTIPSPPNPPGELGDDCAMGSPDFVPGSDSAMIPIQDIELVTLKRYIYISIVLSICCVLIVIVTTKTEHNLKKKITHIGIYIEPIYLLF